MAKIKTIHAREILDSRGNPTVEVTIWTDAGHATVASIPSGASTGKFEALELRDGDAGRYRGLGVLKAVANINTIIAPAVIGQDPTYQTKLDKIIVSLDGTPNKTKLGANAILGVSQAICEVGAMVTGRPTYQYLAEKYQLTKLNPNTMPTPIFNLVNGGKHGAGNNLDFQEFHIIPSSQKSLTQSLTLGDEIYQVLKTALAKRGAVYAVGDEGGFAPNLYNNTDAIDLLIEAIHASNYDLNRDVFLGLDAAAQHFLGSGKYTIRDSGQPMDSGEMIEFWKKVNKKFQLFSLEDGLGEDDFDAWAKLTAEIGHDTMIIGDDLICTNITRLEKAIAQKSCNAALIKPNQIGTISETVEAVSVAKKAGLSVVVSHRSGETNDDFIADFAVGVGANYTKFGAPSRGERVAKYNRLVAIETDLRSRSR